ncbi:MAG TPA: class I SAM-dependent methyltransferase [Phycisphaerales bacterium]|nr:class I SAM-dependent methyltransferase [Phycisphaerales bacterium]
MPTAEQNRRMWSRYDWSLAGEEWTVGFGGPEMAWLFCIRPRIETLAPAGHVLEIGPGHGVWTQFLRPLCRRMTLVDVTERCVEACRERFGRRGMRYIHNDGKSLAGVTDGSVDLAFSFNSLVHADHDAMRGYVRELARVLRPGAYAFLHHSNLAECRAEAAHLSLAELGNRGEDMSAELLRRDCAEAGLTCHVQELIPWGARRLTDCISLVGRATPGGDRPTLVFENWKFFYPAQHMVRIGARYRPPGSGPRGWLAAAAAGEGWAGEQVRAGWDAVLKAPDEAVVVRSGA